MATEAKNKGYRLINNTILSAWAYDHPNKTIRESTLDLDYCVTSQASNGGPVLRSRWSPEDNAIKLSKQYSQGNMELKIEGSVLHLREETGFIFKTVFDLYLNLDDHVRRTPSGRIEWIHPPDKTPAWLKNLSGLGQALSKVPGGAFETAVDLAMDYMKDAILPGNSDEDVYASKNWYRGTYMDDGKLIRHGT